MKGWFNELESGLTTPTSRKPNGHPSVAIDYKQHAEMRVAERFFDYLRAHGIEVSNLRHNRRDPTDALMDSATGMQGIEHAAAHYSEREAANTWAVLRNQPERSGRWIRPNENWRDAVRRMPVLVNFTDALIRNLQRTLDVHAGKRYGVPTYLVLDATTAPLTTAARGPQLVTDLVVPPNTFIAIYLALTTNGTADMEFFQVQTSPKEGIPSQREGQT